MNFVHTVVLEFHFLWMPLEWLGHANCKDDIYNFIHVHVFLKISNKNYLYKFISITHKEECIQLLKDKDNSVKQSTCS